MKKTFSIRRKPKSIQLKRFLLFSTEEGVKRYGFIEHVCEKMILLLLQLNGSGREGEPGDDLVRKYTDTFGRLGDSRGNSSVS